MELAVKTFDELSSREVYEILKSRSEIFIVEQRILCQDMDDVDLASLHCYFCGEGRILAYLRAYPVGGGAVKLGRVLTLRHGEGLGRELLQKSLEAIPKRLTCNKFVVDAQKYAIGFYEKFGFAVTSEEFLEEGIVHVAMEKKL